MRTRIAWLVGATTSAVILAFVVPLCLLVRTMAADRVLGDADLAARNVAILVSSLHGRSALAGAIDQADQRSRSRTTVVLADGTVLGAHDVSAASPDVRRGRAGHAFTLRPDGGARIVVPVVTADGVDVVVTTVTEADLQRGVAAAWTTLGALGLLLLTLSVVAAVRLGRRISTPVDHVAEVAGRLGSGDLSARATVEGPRETQGMATALNRLADRIDELLHTERRRVGEVSHRLRTPVTALRLDVESVSDPDVAERLREHVGALQRSIDTVVAEARRPVRHAMPGTCDATALVRARVEFWSALAEDQGRAVTLDLPARPVVVRLDLEDLADVVDVLIDNVFAHTAAGTGFGVRLSAEGRLVVGDDGGPGRTPPGREGSTGLGLGIVRNLVTTAGGGLAVDTTPEAGMTVVVDLPR